MTKKNRQTVIISGFDYSKGFGFFKTHSGEDVLVKFRQLKAAGIKPRLMHKRGQTADINIEETPNGLRVCYIHSVAGQESQKLPLCRRRG